MTPPSRSLAAALLFTMSLPVVHGAVRPPEDPLAPEPAPVSLRSGDLLLRELTHPPGWFVWMTLKECESMSAAHLRELAHQLWRAERRGTNLTVLPIVLEAWAERDLAEMARDMLTLMQWEHSGPCPEEALVNIESPAARWWCRLARRDGKDALPLLDTVSPDERAHDFWLRLSADLLLPPDRLPVFLTAAAARMPSRNWRPMMERILWTAVTHDGARVIAQAVARIRQREVRLAAQSVVRQLETDPPARAVRKPGRGKTAPENAIVRQLLALDTAPDEPHRIPFALLREVLRLTPKQALKLAQQLPRDTPPGHWLAWMLFMQAADGDPVAAMEVATETGTPLIRAHRPVATLYALRPELDAMVAMREMLAMASPDMQRQAMSGFLTGRAAQDFIAKEWGNPVLGYASQWKLPADYWRAGLCRAAAAGAGVAALRTAQSLPWEPAIGRTMLKEDIIKAWALSDLSSLRRYVAGLESPTDAELAARAFAFVIPFIPAADQLNPDAPLPPELIAAVPNSHWACLALEVREQGFLFFERHATAPAFTGPARAFGATAAHYEPERARALLDVAERHSREEKSE